MHLHASFKVKQSTMRYYLLLCIMYHVFGKRWIKCDVPKTHSRLQVHKERESVLLPIYGVMVPFHVTTIKNVSHTPVSKTLLLFAIAIYVDSCPCIEAIDILCF